MARRYVRDARGRFASGSYQGQTSGRGSRLGAPGRASRRGSTIRASTPAGTIGSRRRSPGAKNSIRATGGVPRPQPRNVVKPTSGRSSRRQPLALKANAVRSFNPKTPKLKLGQLDRQVDRSIAKLDAEIKSMSNTLKKRRPAIDKAGRQLERMNAQALANRLSKNKTDRMVAGVELGIMGGRAGAKALQRRMQRAADAAARGSKPAARARSIYANQLAYMGPGKAKAGRNNLRPGPRNTQGPPKRSRSRKPRR
jgi:hypothetical protein